MLTDRQCKSAVCVEGKARSRFTDANGLYLEVSPAGSKRWFWKLYLDGKESRLALGSYPAVSLADARKARDTARLQKGEGRNPVQLRKIQKLRSQVSVETTFKGVALEWIAKQQTQWSETHAGRMLRQLERDLFPVIGDRQINEIERLDVLAAVQKVEQRGALETADRALMLCRQIWHYALATGKASVDATSALKGALTPYRSTHFAAITEPEEFGVLLRAIDAYRGGPIVRAALKLSPLLFQRPGELRAAQWSEMDLDNGMWTVPAMRMKRNKDGKEFGDPHYVPLSSQAVGILQELKLHTGRGTLVFPGERSRDRPISDNSVRTALISMGYTPDKHTWHGFRATARTLLAERLEFDPHVIEAQLAHAVKDSNGRAYNRTTYLAQRKAMMQSWADYLDRLRQSADKPSA